MATEVDDITTQYRFIHTAGSFVFCIHVLLANGATDSYIWFSVYYSVRKHSLKLQPTHHNNAMEELYCSHSREDYYRKTPSNIVREYRVKCFKVFCTIFQTRKSVVVKFAYKS